MADPEDACQPFKRRFDDEPWVALISRSQHLHPTNCTFDVKVRSAGGVRGDPTGLASFVLVAAQ